MKHAWIVLLFTACVVRLNTPFRLPPPDPDTEPAPGRTSEPREPQAVEPAPPRARARTFDQKSQDAHRFWAGTNYDEVIGLIADGDQAAAEHRDDWAAESAETSCRGAGCLQSGWTTRFPDGKSAETSCRGAGCLQSGWTTRLPDGQSADTSCRGAGVRQVRLDHALPRWQVRRHLMPGRRVLPVRLDHAPPRRWLDLL